MSIQERLKQKIDFKTKPLGALGQLEELALQIGTIQDTENPTLNKPTIITFAGDHGIAESGVSAYPASITPQMVFNFLNGGAAINVFCRQHNIDLKIVDAGVNYIFPDHLDLIDAKVAMGTKNFLYEDAMTPAQLNECFESSARIVNDVAQKGCNIIGFGEMGIGNTSSASLLMANLTCLPLSDCTGKGTGLTEENLTRKIRILQEAQNNHPQPVGAKEALCVFGGFEIAMMCGAMLNAYQNNMIILVDGFIASAALLCASDLNCEIMTNVIFCHESHEQGHKNLLNYLNAQPILSLGMRVGEGTGCAVAYPIIESALLFLDEMATFDNL